MKTVFGHLKCIGQISSLADLRSVFDSAVDEYSPSSFWGYS